MEHAGDVLFGAFELLGEERGLPSKVVVDCKRPAIDSDLSCARISVERGETRHNTYRTGGRAVPVVKVVQRRGGRVDETCVG